MIGSIQISLQINLCYVKWSPIPEQIICWLLCNLHDLIWNSSVSLEKLCLWLGRIFFHTPYTSLYWNQLCPQLSECLEPFHDMNQNVMALVSMDTRQLSVNTLTQFQSFQKTTLSRPQNCLYQFYKMKGLSIQSLTLLADCTTHVYSRENTVSLGKLVVFCTLKIITTRTVLICIYF